MPPLKALLNFFYTENTKLSWPMMQDIRSFQKKLTWQIANLGFTGRGCLFINPCMWNSQTKRTNPPIQCPFEAQVMRPFRQYPQTTKKIQTLMDHWLPLRFCATKPVTYQWSTKKNWTTTRPETNHIALKPCYYTLSIDLIYVPSYLASPVQSLSTAIMYD